MKTNLQLNLVAVYILFVYCECMARSVFLNERKQFIMCTLIFFFLIVLQALLGC